MTADRRYRVRNVVAAQSYGRSGSVFLQSLLDGHPSVLSTPVLYSALFYDVWGQLSGTKDAVKIDRFIEAHDYWFDPAKADYHSGLHRLGADRDQTAYVDCATLWKRLWPERACTIFAFHLKHERQRLDLRAHNHGVQVARRSRQPQDRTRPVHCLVVLQQRNKDDVWAPQFVDGMTFPDADVDRDHVIVRFVDEFDDGRSPMLIDTWHTMRQRKMRRNPSHLALAQQKQIIHQSLIERDCEPHSTVN